MTSTPAARPARFAMRGIRKSFGATVALDGVDLSVAEGEICGLIGQNGSDQTPARCGSTAARSLQTAQSMRGAPASR